MADTAREDDRSEEDRRSGRSVLIKNLRFETSPAKVRRIFEEFGTVRDVYLPLDYYTKRPRGFGFVEFLDARDADAAVRAVNHTMVEGSEVTVVAAQDRRKSPDTMRAISSTGRRSDRGRDFGPRSASRDVPRYDDMHRPHRYDERHPSPRYEDRHMSSRYDDRHAGGGASQRYDDRHGSPRYDARRASPRYDDDDYRRDERRDEHRRTQPGSRGGGSGALSDTRELKEGGGSRRRGGVYDVGRRPPRRETTRSRSREGREMMEYWGGDRYRSPPRDRYKEEYRARRTTELSGAGRHVAEVKRD